MLTVGLVILIVVLVIIVFSVVRSIIAKLFSLAMVVILVVMFLSMGGEKLSGVITPIKMGEETIELNVGGEVLVYDIKDVKDVRTSSTSDGKVSVTFSVQGKTHSIEVSKFAYAWTLRNTFNKEFKGVFKDTTIK